MFSTVHMEVCSCIIINNKIDRFAKKQSILWCTQTTVSKVGLPVVGVGACSHDCTAGPHPEVIGIED
jgi:hypothetical protein